MRARVFLSVLLVLVVYTLINPPLAHAYLDPGTGSVIVQAVVGGIVGVAAIAKLYWTRIKQFIRREKRRP
jgi:flagellar biosynthesis protein FliR